MLLLLLMLCCATLGTSCEQDGQKSLTRNGMLLTRYDADKGLLYAVNSQSPGELAVVARPSIDYSQEEWRVYSASLSDGVLQFGAEWPRPQGLHPLTRLSDSQLTYRAAAGTRKPDAYTLKTFKTVSDPVIESSVPAQYFPLHGGLLLSGTTGQWMLWQDRPSQKFVVSRIPAQGEPTRTEYSDVAVLLTGFRESELVAAWVLRDGRAFEVTVGSTAIKEALFFPDQIKWLSQGKYPGPQGPANGAFAGELFAVKTAAGLETLVGNQSGLLKLQSAIDVKLNGRPRPAIVSSFLVEHAEELAAEGKILPLDRHDSGIQLKPLDAARLFVFDSSYNRIVTIEPAPAI
jgi:hypothetical protein